MQNKRCEADDQKSNTNHTCKPCDNDPPSNAPSKPTARKKSQKPGRRNHITPGPSGELRMPENKGEITYISNFLTREESADLQEQTRPARSWQRSEITLYGRTVTQPRDTAFFGTHLYTYSDENRPPVNWHADPPASLALQSLASRLEHLLNLPSHWFNVVLANRYHHGGDYMGWHSDDESCLGAMPVIASVSVGAGRRFVVRCKTDREKKLEYFLSDGSLIVMSGRLQQFFQHCVPKVALSTCSDLRLNFTFRHVFGPPFHHEVLAVVDRPFVKDTTDRAEADEGIGAGCTDDKVLS